MSAWLPEHDKCQSKASAKVMDSTNTSKPGLESYQAARDLAASWTLTSTSTTVKKTRTFPLPVATISQSTAAKCKQLASIPDIKDDSEAEDSHVLPKGIFPSHSDFFLIAYSQIFSVSVSKKSYPKGMGLVDMDKDMVLGTGKAICTICSMISYEINSFPLLTIHSCDNYTKII